MTTYHELGDLIQDQNPYGAGKLPDGIAEAISKATSAAAAALAANKAPEEVINDANNAIRGAAAAVALGADGAPAPTVNLDIAVDGVPDAVGKSRVSGKLLNQEHLRPDQEVDALFWEFNNEKPFKHGFGYRITKAMKITYTWNLAKEFLSQEDQASGEFNEGKTITSQLLIGFSGPDGDG
jgi:hypothetical protein